jgi:hypothetical protein
MQVIAIKGLMQNCHLLSDNLVWQDADVERAIKG